jgi:DoxX-like family
MDTRTEPSATASRRRPVRWRSAGYWLATAVVAGELALGGIWDIARIPFVADLVKHLGYPSYFLVLLGSWKVLAAAALLIPRRALLKEWAYAGAFFTYTGAIVSHLATGYDLAEVGLLAVLTALTVLSWALRPPSRRISRPAPTAPPAAVSDTAGIANGTGIAHTAAVTAQRTPGSGETAASPAAPRKQR